MTNDATFDLETLTLNVLAAMGYREPVARYNALDREAVAEKVEFGLRYAKVRAALAPAVDAANVADDAYERGKSDTLLLIKFADRSRLAPPDAEAAFSATCIDGIDRGLKSVGVVTGPSLSLKVDCAAPQPSAAEAAATSPTASLVRDLTPGCAFGAALFQTMCDITRQHAARLQMEPEKKEVGT